MLAHILHKHAFLPWQQSRRGYVLMSLMAMSCQIFVVALPQGQYGGSVYCKSCTKLKVERSHFLRNTAAVPVVLVCVQFYTHVCALARLYTKRPCLPLVYVKGCPHTYVHAYAQVSAHVYTHASAHVHTCICMHTHWSIIVSMGSGYMCPCTCSAHVRIHFCAEVHSHTHADPCLCRKMVVRCI